VWGADTGKGRGGAVVAVGFATDADGRINNLILRN
jgi:hypothetical protein